MEHILITLLPFLPLIVEAIFSFSCGIFQLVSGKESILMNTVKRKYNYAQQKERFIKTSGILYIILGCHCVVLMVVSGRMTPFQILLLSLPFLLLLGIGEFCMIKFYTSDLENRKY